MISFEKIERTEAAIRTSPFLKKKEGVIIKLAGMVDESTIRLHQTDHLAAGRSPELCAQLGIELSCELMCNRICFKARPAAATLNKGGYVIFHGEDGESIKVEFMLGSYKIFEERNLMTLLSTIQINFLATSLVKYIDIVDLRKGESTRFTFANQPTYQYESYRHGSELLRIMSRRILGAREILIEETKQRR